MRVTDQMLNPDVEERFDRMSLGLLMAMVAVGILGALVADRPVGLQVNETGFVTRVPAWVAMVVFPGLGYFIRKVTIGSSTPFIRWLGRSLIVFLLVFEIAAFAAA